MSYLRISCIHKWQSLPWDHIYIKVYKMQQNILYALKYYNKKKLYKFRRHIISSSDAKLLTIKQVSDYIYHCYLVPNKTRYYLNNNDKFYIYTILCSCFILDKYIQSFIKKIQGTIIYVQHKYKLEY